MGNTTHGIPWPAGTDLVRDGDNAMKALADKVDLLIPFSINVAAGTNQKIAMMQSRLNITFDGTGRCNVDTSGVFSSVLFAWMTSPSYPFYVALTSEGNPNCQFFARYDQTALVVGTINVYLMIVGVLK